MPCTKLTIIEDETPPTGEVLPPTGEPEPEDLKIYVLLIGAALILIILRN